MGVAQAKPACKHTIATRKCYQYNTVKKSDDQHVQRTRPKHGRRSYISVGIGGDSQSLLEGEPLRSKDKGLLSYNIDVFIQFLFL